MLSTVFFCAPSEHGSLCSCVCESNRRENICDPFNAIEIEKMVEQEKVKILLVQSDRRLNGPTE